MKDLYAKCKECGTIFTWRAGRGCRLKNQHCPSCQSANVRMSTLGEYLQEGNQVTEFSELVK